MEFEVEIGIWRISQDHETLLVSYFKYGEKVAEEHSDKILQHKELYDLLSEFVAITNKEAEDGNIYE